MSWIEHVARSAPEVFLFLAVAIGTLIGRVRIGGFAIGASASILVVSVIPLAVIVWWFRVPSGATCALTVYVPGTGNVLDADGAPATYFVYGTTDASGSRIGQFTVDQVHNQGRWVDAGTVRAPGDRLSVRMMTRGIDFGPGRAGAHLGVSALRAHC